VCSLLQTVNHYNLANASEGNEDGSKSARYPFYFCDMDEVGEIAPWGRGSSLRCCTRYSAKFCYPPFVDAVVGAQGEYSVWQWTQ